MTMTTSTETSQRARETAGATQQQGTELAQSAKGAGQDVARTAADRASTVAGEAKDEARGLARTAKDEVSGQLDTQRGRLAGVLRTTGDELGSAHDGHSQLTTELTRRASDQARLVADYLDDHGPQDILEDVRSFARRRPGTFLVLAAAAGVVAGRVLRGVAQANSNPGPTSQEADYTVSRYDDTTYPVTAATLDGPVEVPEEGRHSQGTTYRTGHFVEDVATGTPVPPAEQAYAPAEPTYPPAPPAGQAPAAAPPAEPAYAQGYEPSTYQSETAYADTPPGFAPEGTEHYTPQGEPGTTPYPPTDPYVGNDPYVPVDPVVYPGGDPVTGNPPVAPVAGTPEDPAPEYPATEYPTPEYPATQYPAAEPYRDPREDRP
jgi:hypothetical protein